MRAVSVVIATYNSKAFMAACLAPIYGLPEIEIIVVDNCSSDGTAEYIEVEFPDVNLIRAPRNLGFAGGNNLGFERCNADTVLLLNPDAFLVDTGQVFDLKKALWADQRTAFVGPQLLNDDGSHQVGDAGYKDSLLSLLGHFWFLHKLCQFVPATYLTNRKALTARRVRLDWICGACLMVKRAVIAEIGGLDDSIFMYGEDVEWGERARRHGMNSLYCPQIKVRHLQGAVRDDGTVKVSTKSLTHRGRKFRARGLLSGVLFKVIVSTGLFARYVIYAVQSAMSASRQPDAQRQKVAQLLSAIWTSET